MKSRVAQLGKAAKTSPLTPEYVFRFILWIDSVTHTMKPIELYLGLDVHKDSATLTTAEPGLKGFISLEQERLDKPDQLQRSDRFLANARHKLCSSPSGTAQPAVQRRTPPAGA